MGKLCRHAFATVACLLFVFLWLTAGNRTRRPWSAAVAQPLLRVQRNLRAAELANNAARSHPVVVTRAAERALMPRIRAPERL